MKRKLYLHITCFFIISLSVLGTYLFISSSSAHKFHNNVCQATINFKLNDDSHNFEYILFLRVNFIDTGYGYEDMRGEVFNDGKRYTVARTIDFNYRNKSNSDIYEVTVANFSKAGHDNLTDDLVAKHLSYTLPKSFIFLKIDEIDQHMMLISGTQGPVLICNLP